MPAISFPLLSNQIIADNFAGGGGASTAIELACGRSPDLAINHDPEAIAMHAANHPTTKHYLENVWKVDPRAACADRPVGLAWFSPDCKHHSKAKGGKPREQKIRGLAWFAVTWAARVRPNVIALENVEEFREWGPLHRQHTHGCTNKAVKRTPRCSQSCRIGMPIQDRKGETFKAFLRKLERKGYVVEYRLLRACDFGAPTTRRRLFLIARCDGKPIVWPEATHGPGRSQPYRTAADVIDWSISCPSIFDRSKPIVHATRARIARGVQKFILEAPQPYLVDLTKGDQKTSVAPYLIHRSNGERHGQAPRIYEITAPHPTVVAQGLKTSLVVAFIAKHYSERRAGEVMGQPINAPLATITTIDHDALVTGAVAEWTTEIESRARHVYAFMRALGYDGPNYDHERRVITIQIGEQRFVIYDLAMRMLTPRELFRAQGFPEDYRIEFQYKGKRLSKTAQIRMCGNSVSPPVAAALLQANLGSSLESFS